MRSCKHALCQLWVPCIVAVAIAIIIYTASSQNTSVQINLQQQQEQTTVVDVEKRNKSKRLALIYGIASCVLAVIGGCYPLSCAIPALIFAIMVSLT